MDDKDEYEEIKKRMKAHKHLMHHKRNWLRHNAMVPKGFLRFHVLEALNAKPMSGSELMEEIQKHTGGSWKPSPGSIYPLLAWLQDNQYIKELPHENGLKRYELTQSGKTFLEEQTKIRDKIRQDTGFMTHPIFDKFFGSIPEEKTDQLRGAIKNLFISSVRLGKNLRERYSEKELIEAIKVLDETSQKLDVISERLKANKQ
jgi:DNA-binding PadR family transcriptional regulator